MPNAIRNANGRYPHSRASSLSASNCATAASGPSDRASSFHASSTRSTSSRTAVARNFSSLRLVITTEQPGSPGSSGSTWSTDAALSSVISTRRPRSRAR